MLGLPGSVSFARFDALVRRAGALESEIRTWSDAVFATEAAAPAASARSVLQRTATERFLAVAREAARRTVGMRAFDEQLVACCALLSGHAVEMDTGEGKTLVGALAAAGHARAGRRVHVISVNDYLAQRDAEWMRPFFEALGVSIGWVGQHTSRKDRQRTYECDVVYVPVSEVGFDVLRDRFVVASDERVAPVFDVAIVDEADAVMVDEAMLPLVLAGTSDEGDADDLGEATTLIEHLRDGIDFVVDAERTTVVLTDLGLDSIELRLGGINLYDAENTDLLTRINLALHARVLVRRDVDYLVEGEAIKLINTGRGRVAHRQRWPDGLHAAIESKERLAASAAGVLLDSITIQDLLLGYRTLSGMSGTVLAVAEDLAEFYGLPAGRVDRHKPNRRVDEPDRVLIDEAEKLPAIVDEVVSRHRAGQPALVGTQSVAESEHLAARLAEMGIRARVLNAKNDADEAAIIAGAGEYGAVTISTQMSGRGTDIRLGGVDERDRDRVLATGGLAVIAAGRYPSRRLDAQLRGRAGRQGDPGTSIVFASLGDELVQANAPTHLLTEIARAGERLAVGRRRYILDRSQAIAEGMRLDRHRATWGYNRAIAAQRAAVLRERREIADADLAATTIRDRLPDHLRLLERERGAAVVADAVRAVALHHLDERWVDHLALLQEIRDGIHLRALAGERPLEEFHRIALREFHGFFDGVYRDAADFVETLRPEDIGRDLEDLGLRRPSATWTYMITDDPLGSPGDRLANELGKRWRSTVLRIE
ncbi:accessory Sec system translocase SecA2 [Okibacterium endophyticum]